MIETLTLWDDDSEQTTPSTGRDPAPWIEHHGIPQSYHDHSCCPGDTSCGQCIRGILCRRCNRILITNNPQILRGLADYLDQSNA